LNQAARRTIGFSRINKQPLWLHFQPLGYHFRQLISHLVAQAVVHVLELVEIEEDDGNQVAVAMGFQHRLVQTVVEQRAVRQTGQRIMCRLEVNLRFMQLALSRIAVPTFGKFQVKPHQASAGTEVALFNCSDLEPAAAFPRLSILRSDSFLDIGNREKHISRLICL
jgi:hypothetical protein